MTTYIPDKAFEYLDDVYNEQARIFPNHPLPPYFPSLIEQESCIHLKHKRCWDPTSELKTHREQGVGLGQLTRAWRKSGRLRFDTLDELRRKHKDELRNLTWKNIKYKPDLQIRAILLLYRDNWNKLPGTITDPIARLSMTDMAYNAGIGRVFKDRRLCGLKKDCDPKKYWGNMEKVCTASKRVLYGNKSACDIMKDHVELSLKTYRDFF
jgi:hypothetical protein